jgi:hypothetical protein
VPKARLCIAKGKPISEDDDINSLSILPQEQKNRRRRLCQCQCLQGQSTLWGISHQANTVQATARSASILRLELEARGEKVMSPEEKVEYMIQE